MERHLIEAFAPQYRDGIVRLFDGARDSYTFGDDLDKDPAELVGADNVASARLSEWDAADQHAAALAARLDRARQAEDDGTDPIVVS